MSKCVSRVVGRAAVLCLVVACVMVGGSAAALGQKASSKVSGPSVLKLSVQNFVGFTPEYVALKKGWLGGLLTKYHVKLQSEPFDSGAAQVTALLSGSLDVGTIGGSPTVSLIAQGAPVDFPYVADEGLGIEGLVVEPNSGIKSVKDLVGKSVGVPLGTSGEFMLRSALRYAGVNPSSVRMVNLDTSALPAAFRRHDIQASWVFDPYFSQLKQLGGKVIMTDADVVRETKGADNDTWDVYAVRSELMKKYPAFMRAFFSVINRAAVYTNAHRRQIANTMFDKLGANNTQEALSQLNGDTLLTAARNRSSAWLGAPGRPGQFPSVVEVVAKFLSTGGEIQRLPSRSDIAKHFPPLGS